MVFSSLKFIFIFLPAFFIVYGFVPPSYKNAVLFLGSIIFYCMGVLEYPVYIWLFLLTIVFNFIIGEFIAAFRKASKVWLTIGITFNFLWLIFFKYTRFIFENINEICSKSAFEKYSPAYRNKFLYVPERFLYYRCLPP